ncbi:response regulator [candidate division KSB1 bacterium]
MEFDKEEARILIVDDTQKNIQVLGAILKKEKYQINVAMNGLQALKQVEKVHPDLILLDVMMPELDGFETCKRLKADPETKDIPVIFLTAKVEVEDIVKGFELGAVDYVTKPFNHTELLARVDTHLQLKLAREQIEKYADELKEWNEKLEEKLDARTKEIKQMNDVLIRKNKVLEIRDEIVEYILDVHDIDEAKEFIVGKIFDLVSLNKIIIYSLDENNTFPARYGFEKSGKKAEKISQDKLNRLPSLPVLDVAKFDANLLKGTSDSNKINEFSMFLPLVKEGKHIGYLVLDNSGNKQEIGANDIEIAVDFASLMAIVIYDYAVTHSTEEMEESIKDVLENFS